MADRQQVLEAQVRLLAGAHDTANDALRSALAVAEREGQATNWPAFIATLRYSLEVSHAATAAIREGGWDQSYVEKTWTPRTGDHDA